MKHISVFIFAYAALCSFTVLGQLDSLQVLPEVILSDVKLSEFSQGNTIQKVSDSTLLYIPTALTQVIRSESLIYLRENGLGGVASPSFRGTTAQQTAVVWNGLNINSQLNGQTDFNTIASKNYDNLTIRSGGGSIPYGSGAIGGSVHLNNDIRFGERFDNRLAISYGSFNTPSANYKMNYGSNSFHGDIGVDYTRSDNDFEYLGTSQVNENGEFENTNINANFGVKLSQKHLLKFYHNTFLGNRNFSGTLTAPSDDAYQDRNTRSLLEWNAVGTHSDSKLRFAHVFEQFRYFPSGSDSQISTIGKAIRYTTNYDFTYRFGKGKTLQSTIDYTSVSAEGTSIERSSRDVLAAYVLWNHKVNQRWSYGAQVRQELTEAYDSPLLFGLSSGYAITNVYSISLNFSKNYRIPTFNDVYWEGDGAKGNPDLRPETSYQATLGQKIQLSDFSLEANVFYIQSNDLIVWRPITAAFWSPINVAESENYGAELSLKYDKHFGTHHFSITGQYGYTQARDVEKKTQLIYVPEHKFVGSIGYTWNKLSAFCQVLSNGDVFTTTDNTSVVDGYTVSNVGSSYRIMSAKKNTIDVSLQARNIFNKNYQTVAFRPNPGRNFLIQTTYTF